MGKPSLLTNKELNLYNGFIHVWYKEAESYDHHQDKKWTMETCEQMIQIVGLSQKNIKITNVNMLLIIREKIENDKKINFLY